MRPSSKRRCRTISWTHKALGIQMPLHGRFGSILLVLCCSLRCSVSHLSCPANETSLCPLVLAWWHKSSPVPPGLICCALSLRQASVLQTFRTCLREETLPHPHAEAGHRAPAFVQLGNVANWRSNLETAHILAIFRGFFIFWP